MAGGRSVLQWVISNKGITREALGWGGGGVTVRLVSMYYMCLFVYTAQGNAALVQEKELWTSFTRPLNYTRVPVLQQTKVIYCKE